VVKSYRRRRIVGVKYRVVFGTMERVQQVLSAYGRKINTAFVERLNLDIRQRVAAVGRRVNTLCQGEASLQKQLALYHC
jgi:IS1 family transposase